MEAFRATIAGAFPNLVEEQTAAMRAKGAPLTPDEMSQLNAELVERSKAIAAGFERLRELGVSRERLEERPHPLRIPRRPTNRLDFMGG